MTGWIKLHRDLLNKAIFDNEKLFKVFMWCLLKASHKEHDQLVGRQKVSLMPGQFITGRNKASIELSMPPSTVWDYLKLLETNESINIKSNNKYSIVSVLNWGLYQSEIKVSDNKTNNKPTTDKQQMDTNKNDKNDKKETYTPIINYLNEKANKRYKATTNKTQSLISARIKEGFTIDDFKKVIDIKVSQWIGDDDMNKYLRPETLFGNKFESYLNENISTKSESKQQGASNWRGSDKRL